MLPDKIKVLNIPLTPYLPPGRNKTLPTKRIRPADSLNLKNLVKEINKSTVITLDINQKPWSVVSVYSSYSPDIHIMLVETSPNRYLPGPEAVPDKEGNSLMKLWAEILNFLAQRHTNASLHSGYNWSPRSWGEQEEKTGFQSILTKWHPQLWGWPSFNVTRSINKKFVKSVKSSQLSHQERSLLGDNDYAEPFGQLISEKLLKTFRKELIFKLFPYKNWCIDGRGILASSRLPVVHMLKYPDFFSRLLKPLAIILDDLTRDLTEIMTTTNCREIDKILLATEKGRPKNWKRLRHRPLMRSEGYIRNRFKQSGFPENLLNAVFDPVKNRCNEQGAPENWWRKGFGYAVVFNGRSKSNFSTIRIMPGVYVGPGGVVEANGVLLKRSEVQKLSDIEIREKGKVLRQLAEHLKKKGFHEYKR